MTQIVLNGAPIDSQFLVSNIVWDVIVVFVLWPLVYIEVKRLRATIAHLKSHGNKRGDAFATNMSIRMAHVLFMALAISIASIDPCEIYFDSSRSFILGAYHLFDICGTNMLIFIFFSNVEVFLLTFSSLRMADPVLLRRVRLAWMVMNLSVGLALVLVHLVVRLHSLQFAFYMWIASQFLLLGSVMIFLVFFVSRSVVKYHDGNTDSPRTVGPVDPQKGIRRFQKVGYLLASVVIGLGFGLVISFTPMLGPSSESYNQEDPTFSSREHNATFYFEWSMWAILGTQFLVIYLQWLPPAPKRLSKASKTGMSATNTRSGASVGIAKATGPSSPKYARHSRVNGGSYSYSTASNINRARRLSRTLPRGSISVHYGAHAVSSPKSAASVLLKTQHSDGIWKDGGVPSYRQMPTSFMPPMKRNSIVQDVRPASVSADSSALGEALWNAGCRVSTSDTKGSAYAPVCTPHVAGEPIGQPVTCPREDIEMDGDVAQSAVPQSDSAKLLSPSRSRESSHGTEDLSTQECSNENSPCTAELSSQASSNESPLSTEELPTQASSNDISLDVKVISDTTPTDHPSDRSTSGAETELGVLQTVLDVEKAESSSVPRKSDQFKSDHSLRIEIPLSKN